MSRVNFSFHNTFTQWNFGPFSIFILVVTIAAAVLYLRADWKLATRGRRWSSWRTTAFFSGLLTVWLAFSSSVSLFANTYFQAHVIQHLMLMVIAPPLLALGAPSTMYLQTTGRSSKTRWLKFLHSDAFAVISNPLSVGVLYYGVMFIFFLTPLINLAMHHMALMDLINMVFLLGATLFWWPMVGVDPIMRWKMGHGARLLNILIGSGLEAFLGVAILNDSHPAATMYTLSSTHAGGALLWVASEFISLAAFLPIYLQWMHSEDRAGARYGREQDARRVRVEAALGSGVENTESTRPRTAWEMEWLARTGSIPRFEEHVSKSES